ncbi:hypothetical protein D3C80_1605160 [compost metagenome]
MLRLNCIPDVTRVGIGDDLLRQPAKITSSINDVCVVLWATYDVSFVTQLAGAQIVRQVINLHSTEKFEGLEIPS